MGKGGIREIAGIRVVPDALGCRVFIVVVIDIVNLITRKPKTRLSTEA